MDFGLFTAHRKINDLVPGTYLALLWHSGSRGTGVAVCDHYSKLAVALFPDFLSESSRQQSDAKLPGKSVVNWMAIEQEHSADTQLEIDHSPAGPRCNQRCCLRI